MSLNLDNLRIESGALCLRELREGDCEPLEKIIRDYTVNSTLLLYSLYIKDKETKARAMCENGLDMLRDAFKKFDVTVSGSVVTNDDYKRLKDVMEKYYPDELLFSPYGPIKPQHGENFEKKVKEYIETAQTELKKPKREFFRMGIEYQETLIGGFTFDIIEDAITDDHDNTYRTIGDIGAFLETSHRNRLAETLYCAAYLINHLIGSQDKIENLYISVITHPLNSETHNLLEKRGWNLIDSVTSHYGNEKRKRFVATYTDIINKFLLQNHEKPARITKIITEEGL
jgi:hypothetical protein